MKTIKTEKQYGNHYEQISMHLRMLQAGASTGSLLDEPPYPYYGQLLQRMS